MQDQLQQQIKEQLEKIQQNLMDKMTESQGSMMTELTRLLTNGKDKGKSPVANIEEKGDEGPLYPPGFTHSHAQPQVEFYPRKSSVTIKPQQFQADVLRSMNYQAGSGSSPENNLVNPVVPNFDGSGLRRNSKQWKLLRDVMGLLLRI
ncbi:hypothetical protein Godav_028888 [Gossypium davidsonii]|uniref:Uncharacterized protein n=1 Tax=Gossypium davidsonii TaxID=34287 RepID=A0A7J8TH13_GOSDV|nr:hypothetical protein [Gossypium davidsonii]